MDFNSMLVAEAHTALVETIKGKLKAQVLAAIDKELDAAVSEAVRALEPAINMYNDPYIGRQIVEVIVTRK